MSSMIADCMALFRDKNIMEKYALLLRHGGHSGPSGGYKTGADYKVNEVEKAHFIKEYEKKVPTTKIALAAKRSTDTVRRILKTAGVFEVDRDKLGSLLAGHETIKTTYTNRK